MPGPCDQTTFVDLPIKDQVGEPGLNEADLKRVSAKTLSRVCVIPGPWEMQLWGYGETLPRYENHCRLSETETDKWGIPQLIVSADWGENELAMRKDCAESAQEMMETAGFKDIRVTDDIENNPQGLAIHEMGTARMGRDPQNIRLECLQPVPRHTQSVCDGRRMHDKYGRAEPVGLPTSR